MKQIVFVFGIVAGLCLTLLATDSFGWWGSDGLPYPRATEALVLEPILDSASPVFRESATTVPPASLPNYEFAGWWEDVEYVASLTNQFAADFPDYRSTFLLDCDRGLFGDLNIELSGEAWRMFHSLMTPSLEMLEGLSQGEKWVAAIITQRAGMSVDEFGGYVPEDLSPTDELEFRRRLRDESLFFSPEFILNMEYGNDWDQRQGLVQEIRTLWIEMMRIAAPLETEINLRQRCAMNLLPNIQRRDVHFIAPSILQYENELVGIHQEFYDKAVWLIRDFQGASGR